MAHVTITTMFIVMTSFHMLAAQSDLNRIEVNTPSGPITGFIQPFLVDSGGIQLNETMDTFLGVPYAEPPIGELRFNPFQRYLGRNG